MAFQRKHPDSVRAMAAALFRETSIPLTEIAVMAGVRESTAQRWVEKVEAPHRRNGRGVVPKDEIAQLRTANHALEDALDRAWEKLAKLDHNPTACDAILEKCKAEIVIRIPQATTKLGEIAATIKAIHDIQDREAGKPTDSRPEWLDELQGTLLAFQAQARPAPETLTDHDRGLIVDDPRGSIDH